MTYVFPLLDVLADSEGGGRQGEGVSACGGGVCLAKGVSTWPGEVSAWPEGVCPGGGVSA